MTTAALTSFKFSGRMNMMTIIDWNIISLNVERSDLCHFTPCCILMVIYPHTICPCIPIVKLEVMPDITVDEVKAAVAEMKNKSWCLRGNH